MTRQALHTYVPKRPPELAIEPALPQAFVDIDGQTISELTPGRGGQSLVEPVTEFKRSVDRRLVQLAKGDHGDPWLAGLGFNKRRPTARGVPGNSFINWLFGGFFLHELGTDLCRVPAWACIGWNRKQRPALGTQAAIDVSLKLDDDTRRNTGEYACGAWFEPFPLVLMGEGQNRVDLYHQHGLPLLVNLHRATLAPSESLRLQRVLGCEDVVVLHCRDRRFWPRGASTALLPFPALAVPLLEAYGVGWAKGRHLLMPCSPSLMETAVPPHEHAARGLERWRPRAWRSMFLSQAYV